MHTPKPRRRVTGETHEVHYTLKTQGPCLLLEACTQRALTEEIECELARCLPFKQGSDRQDHIDALYGRESAEESDPKARLSSGQGTVRLCRSVTQCVDVDSIADDPEAA